MTKPAKMLEPIIDTSMYDSMCTRVAKWLIGGIDRSMSVRRMRVLAGEGKDPTEAWSVDLWEGNLLRQATAPDLFLAFEEACVGPSTRVHVEKRGRPRKEPKS